MVVYCKSAMILLIGGFTSFQWKLVKKWTGMMLHSVDKRILDCIQWVQIVYNVARVRLFHFNTNRRVTRANR
jgi:hypothetical protein